MQSPHSLAAQTREYWNKLIYNVAARYSPTAFMWYRRTDVPRAVLLSKWWWGWGVVRGSPGAHPLRNDHGQLFLNGRDIYKQEMGPQDRTGSYASNASTVSFQYFHPFASNAYFHFCNCKQSNYENCMHFVGPTTANKIKQTTGRSH